MGNHSIDNKNISSIILYTTAFAVAFIGWMAPVPVIALTLCCWWLSFQRHRSGEKMEINATSAIMLAFYLFCLFADILNGIPFSSINRMDFQIRLPLLLLSLAFLFKHNELERYNALKFHALGSYATATIVIITFLWEISFDFSNLERNIFHLRQCLAAVFIAVSHRSYINFNLLIALIFVFQWYNRKPSKQRLLSLATVSIATGAFIFLSEARTSLISFGALLSAIIFLVARERVTRKQLYLLLAVCGLSFFCIAASSPRIINLFHSLMKGDAAFIQLDPRFQIWSCAYDIASKGIPFFGLGSRELQPLLQECYTATQFRYGETCGLGAHNQFIEVLLEYGFIGLSLLVALLASLGATSKSNRKEQYLLLLMIGINLFFETMLSRSIGAYNIAFLLALSGNTPKSQVENSFSIKNMRYAIIPMILVIAIGFIRCNKSKYFVTFQKDFITVEVLPGEVPHELNGERALRIDKSTPTENWGEVAFMNFYFNELKVNESDLVHFDLYVYVDEAFDGSLVRIKLDERNTNVFECFYDLDKKGTWQKLSIDKDGLKGSVLCNISIDKTPAKDFSDMKGYILFCQPNIQLTHSDNAIELQP